MFCKKSPDWSSQDKNLFLAAEFYQNIEPWNHSSKLYILQIYIQSFHLSEEDKVQIYPAQNYLQAIGVGWERIYLK